jgi:acyl-coenzyme A thioesterase PaaI-like protein
MEEIIKYSGCFVCGDEHPEGLRIRFFRDGENAVADCIAEPKYQGYKGIYHGGLVATLLDEIMAKAVLAIQRYAMTAEMTCRFKKAVPVGEKLRLTGRITGRRGRLFETAAEITGADGTVYATATGKYLEVPNPALRDLL